MIIDIENKKGWMGSLQRLLNVFAGLHRLEFQKEIWCFSYYI